MARIVKKPSAKRPRARRPKTSSTASMQPAWQRTRQLVEAMLEVMEKGIRQPDCIPEQWDRLFGAKSSAVANLEKLVQVLVELHGQVRAQEEGVAEDAPLTHDEVALLSEWLGRAPSPHAD